MADYYGRGRPATLPRYYDRGKPYLELHNNRTCWQLDNPAMANETDNYSLDLYASLVDEAVANFTDRTGRDLYLLGRSGRHCCVQDIPANSRQYQWLKKIALRLEKQLINEFNQFDPKSDAVMGLESDVKDKE